MGTPLNYMGEYAHTITIRGRAYIGCGHTAQEAQRNAWDLVADKCPALEGWAAIMRSAT